MVKTKIIATLGPASSSPPVLRKMMLAGLDVVRLNFSHATLSEHKCRISLFRELNKKYRRNIKILGDLEGYRIRIGSLRKPVEIKKRQVLYLAQEKGGSSDNVISFDYAGNLKDIKKGQYIYIDDGNIALVVLGHKNKCLQTKVMAGGILKGHKGVNIPGVRLKFSGITEKDKNDIKFCVENDLDYIAQSFVRSKKDILEIRQLLRPGAYNPKIIAKIENRDGINNIGEIAGVSDGIMVARGDMGVSLPIYEVPVVQKQIIKKCRKAGKFVIVATQMLESMMDNLRPTRAEVSDVANAIIDGADYVMLSAETAVGNYPAETVGMMNQIIKFTEGNL
jgi:pyruvate kinase